MQSKNANNKQDNGSLDPNVDLQQQYAVEEEIQKAQSIGRSTAMMSLLVLLSRLTGFLRTWGQAFALGVTALASCYTVANNLPNQLYELVLGGLISTAFLPVYLSLKQKVGQKGANAYASNLISLVIILMGIITLLGFIFAYQVVLTQSAGASAEFDHNLAVFFFRFFVIECVLYALSSILSGLLNAERDYFWSNAAPIFNNIICILSFLGAWFFFQEDSYTAAVLTLAIGNPLGVLVQVLLQVPSLKKHNIHLTFRVDVHDPAIKETLSIGIPSLIAMICAFVTVSVQSSYALQCTAQGAAIIYYARLWFTLPYAILAIPITVAMFTELSDSYSQNDMSAFKKGIVEGCNRIFFFLIPFAFYVFAFAPALIALFNAGSFTQAELSMTANYLAALAISLPFYGICTFLQKVCSSYRRMITYAIATVVASVAQVLVCVIFTPIFGLNIVGLSSIACFGLTDLIAYLKLRKDLGDIQTKRILWSVLRSCILGAIGAIVGFAIFQLLQLNGFAPTGFIHGLIICLVAGIPAVIATYGLALALHISEARYISSILKRKSR